MTKQTVDRITTRRLAQQRVPGRSIHDARAIELIKKRDNGLRKTKDASEETPNE